MSKQRAAGTRFESSLLPLLNQYYPGAERRALQGALDKGDFVLPGNEISIWEAKNCARLDLAGWIREAQVEARNASRQLGVVVHKRVGVRDPAQQYVTLLAGDYIRVECLANNFLRTAND